MKALAAEEPMDRLPHVYNNLLKAHKWIKVQTDHSHSHVLAYTTGQLVWLSTDNLHLPCTSEKLSM